jgi:hypothetical protein
VENHRSELCNVHEQFSNKYTNGGTGNLSKAMELLSAIKSERFDIEM